MVNTTQIPAFRGEVGDWTYYVCMMTYAEVARQIGFAYEQLGANKDLATMIQRGITPRTIKIRDYILNNEERFLGALLVGVWGGEPRFEIVEMAEQNVLMPNLDEGIGFLVLDGSQVYFALDGQHRLRAIKDAIEEDPDLGREKIAVLFVPHTDTDSGRERTRRLFTAINRTAKPTTKAENIALDEDDGFAIVTRMLVDEHEWLSLQGVVRVGTWNEGEIKLATSAIPRTDKKAWSNMVTLYEMTKALDFGLDPQMSISHEEMQRPDEAVIEQAHAVLSRRIDDLLISCGNVRQQMEDASSAQDVRSPSADEGRGHAFMRPVVQRYLAQVLGEIVGHQKSVDWPTAMSRLSTLDWELGKAPWTSVYNTESKRMITGRDNTALLRLLLAVHLAPQDKQEIEHARREYRNLIGSDYPVSAEALEQNLPQQSG